MHKKSPAAGASKYDTPCHTVPGETVPRKPASGQEPNERQKYGPSPRSSEMYSLPFTRQGIRKQRGKTYAVSAQALVNIANAIFHAFKDAT